MAISIVVGGQFGSEGKGKIAYELARDRHANAVVRVGGSNSGHTAVADTGERHILRQLPTAALLPDPICVLAAGSYIDIALLLDEIEQVGIAPDRLFIDRNAVVITAEDRAEEAESNLGARIGSTCSGTGAAVMKRVARVSRADLAETAPELAPFIADTVPMLRHLLDGGGRIVIEGTQGYGLSLLHSPHFPYATTRDTTAAGALSEVGLSPLDVDEIVLVIRAFPIRVAGNSGPFESEEVTWEDIVREGAHDEHIREVTSVTRRLRRVAKFDPELVRRAIAANRPSEVVLNHLDYVDSRVRSGCITETAREFVTSIEESIGHRVHRCGVGPADTIPWMQSSRQPLLH